MKNIEISIAKLTILDIVSQNSAYSGAKGDPGSFERIATFEGDDDLLSRLWVEMCGQLSERFREFITGYSMTSDSLKVTMEVSGSYDDSLTESVIEDLCNGIASGVTARWFQFSNPSVVKEWKDESSRLFLSAFSKLCHRRRPVRGPRS